MHVYQHLQTIHLRGGFVCLLTFITFSSQFHVGLNKASACDLVHALIFFVTQTLRISTINILSNYKHFVMQYT